MANKTTNRTAVPGAKAAMEQFKMQAANEVGVDLNKGYNGELTSREAGSIGGQMVKTMTPVRTFRYIRGSRTDLCHEKEVGYRIHVLL